MAIINPVTQTLTHLVVAYGGSEYLVPLDEAAASAPECIILSCTRAELGHMDLFSTTHFIETDLPDITMYDAYGIEPYVYIEHDILYEEERIPAGELAIRRGSEVHACGSSAGGISFPRLWQLPMERLRAGDHKIFLIETVIFRCVSACVPVQWFSKM
jgi:hypothetical protein